MSILLLHDAGGGSAGRGGGCLAGRRGGEGLVGGGDACYGERGGKGSNGVEESKNLVRRAT